MTESKVSSSSAFSPRAKKASVAENESTLQNGDMAGDIRSFEFDECSGNSGVVLENKDPGSPSRARTALGNIRIADLLPGSRAKQDGLLEVGDRVLEINGRDLSKASLERARWYLGSAVRSGKLRIKVLRGLTESNITPRKNSVVPTVEMTPETSRPKNRVKKIHILKDSRGLGVQILMKLNHETGEKGVFVSDVSPGGAAARDGRLKEGDELLWINGHSLIGVTQQEAVDLLRASPKLIQLVISIQGSESSLEKKVPGTPSKDQSLENVSRRAAMQGTRNLPRAPSTENLLHKGRKMSSDHMEKKSNMNHKHLEKATAKSNGPALQQSVENGPSKKADHNLVKDSQIKVADLLDESHNEQNHVPFNGNASELTNGRCRSSSSSSDSSNGPAKSNTGDVLLSKGEESLESEPVTLEDKPLSTGSTTKASTRKLPSPPVIDASKKRHSPNPLLNTPTSKDKPSSNGTCLEPGQISPSLPRPQSPGGMGIAFSARYLGDPPSNVMTIAMPTPRNLVGSNERDSPQAKTKWSNESSQRRTSKAMEEEIVTIVLVKGMSGKGLGFTIVGGKGSPHGDMAVYIKSILSGGAAEADGRMKKGDEVLSVNGTSFEGFTHQEALDTFKNLRRGIVTLKVRRNSPGAPSVSTFTTPRSSPGSSRRNSKDVTAESSCSSSNSSSPTMFRKLRQKRSQKEKITEIVLYKEPGNSLGIGLGEQHPSTRIPGVFVQCVIQGTPAAHDGRLRQGDQLLEINDMKLEGKPVENIYSILDKVPPGKVYIKVVQSNASDKLPLRLNDELTKLQSEQQVLDKKVSGKSKSVGTASTLSGASGSSESCENMTSLSSSCDPLIPLAAEPNKKKKSQALRESDDDVFTNEPDSAEYLEDIYTIIKQPTGGLGMGVTIDKSRGNTIAEGVSIKSVTEGGSAALARSPRGVGLKLGDQIVEVNGTHLRGMDQEDVIKIFRDLPSSTQMKIRRSKMAPQELDSAKTPNKRKESFEKTATTQDPVPLPKPPESRRRSSQRGKLKPVTQEDKTSSPEITDGMALSERVEARKESGSPVEEYASEKIYHNGIKVAEKSQDQERTIATDGGEQSTTKSPFTKQVKPVLKDMDTSKDLKNKTSDKLKDELGDNLFIPSGYRKMTITISKGANSTLGLSLVPSYGNLKGFFQIRRLQSGMVCAQDGQLHIGDKLVSVNGVSLKGVTHSMALQLLKKPMELVTFVILREGVEPQRRVSSPSSQSKSDSSSGQNSAAAQKKGIISEPLFTIKTEQAEKLPRCEKPVPPIKSQRSIDSEKLDKRSESHSTSSEDGNAEEDVPKVPCTPPPSPLVGVDHLLDSDLSVLPPSFSPPPPPELAAFPSLGDEDVSLSAIPVVSPPPDLSPRMKEFLEKDPFSAADHQEKNSLKFTHDDEILPESSSTLNQASSPGSEAVVGWDFQSLLDACNDLNTYENDDVFTSERTSITEAPSVTGDSKPKVLSVLSTETKNTKENNLQKRLETSIGSPAVENRNDVPCKHSKSQLSRPGFGERDKGLRSTVEEHNTKDLTTPPKTTEHKLDDDVKPVAGRRVENVPFVITYQKKFRSLGVKVDLTEEGEVIVSDVSSFGLVGKDGNIRVGDVLLSINDTSLEAMAPEDVQNMIKNCPRGDVRIVAQAGPKPPKPTEAVEETVFSPDLKERGQLDDMSDKNNQAGRETVPDVLSNVAVHKPRVDMPSELTSQKNTDTSGRTVPNLFSSNKLPDTRGKVSSTILPQDHTDDFTTTEECEGIGLESTDFDDLPPSTPPPPIPVNDLQVEDYSGDVDEPLVQDIVQDVSFNPPTNFEDFVDDKIESALSYDSEEEACRAPPKPLRILGLAAQPHGPSTVQTKYELSRKTDVPSGSGQERKMPAEDIQPQIPIKPPSLFGDDTESESIRPDAPQKLVKNSSVEDAAMRESSQWNGLEDSPIKPPSLFDDELESLPSLPSAPPPPKLSKHFISLDTVSSTSSSPLQSPRFDRESLNHSPSTQRSNFSVESGSSSPSHGRGSTLGIPDPFSDMPIQPPDVVDDDMSSLPPAPPPPRSPVNRSSSWSVRSDTSAPLQHGNVKVPHISSPLPKPAKPERKNSKKRILPLRIRSKRGRKTSEQSDSSYVTDGHRESSPQGFVAPIISSDVNQPTSLTHVEPPEDDMESLPPAPPPPRMSPLTVESLESIADGLQPVKVKTTPSRSVSEERRAITPTGVAEPLHSSQQSPKKKKKSFRRNVIQMEAEGSLPEYGGSSVNVPVVPEMDRAVDNSLKHLTPLEDEVAVTDSSDAMSPPPLPPQMELWSEAGAAEAELALLDQILTLEDSSRSGNEQSSEDGTSSSTKPTSFSTELSYVDTKSMESKEGSANNKSKEARYIMTKEGSSDTNITTSSLEELADMDSRGIPELEPVNLNSSVNATGANVESEAYSPVVDLQERKTSDTVHQKPSGRLLKQLSEGGDPAGNLIKHRRPAPPIPARPSANSKASTVPRKSLPGGIPVLPSRPDIKPKATPSPHEPTPNHHRDQQRLSSPVKEKTSRKLFSRSHKGKDKRADSNNLESPDTSFNSNPEGRERSRSWTKKLFGFRSRSRSKNRDKSKDLENRSRSVSPPRGFFSRSRRSSPPLPPATTKKDPLSKHKKEIERKDPVIDDIERYIPVEETPVLSQTLPSTFRLSDPFSQIRNHVEGNNNKFGSPTTGDGDSSPEVEGSILNFQPRTDVSLTVPDETYRDESQFKNVDLNHEEKESESDIQGTSLLSDDEYVTTPDAHFGVDASLTNRPLPPLPPQREKHPDATALITADNDKENAVEDKLPMKPPYKPPVPKRPEFLKSVSTPSRQQQETMDELKQKINKASSFEDRLETAPDMTEDPIFNTEVDDMPDSDDLPSPGPPTFTPVPPPLTLGTSSSPVEKDDSNKTARCPNSPGPPRFKPPPPPLSLKAIAVQNDVTSDETLDSPISPGPPKFKPAPPPIDLQFQNKNIDSEEQDVPSTADIPNIKPLPPIPVAGKMQRQEDPFSAERIVMEGTSVEGDAVPALQNDERRKTKPLPPIPTSFNLKTKDNSHKLPLSRQDAQECDNKEDVDNPEMSEQNPEPPLPQVTLSEDNNYSQVSQVVEPDITQDATHEVNASNIDDLDSSELSSEWDDTCSSTQGDSGQPGAGSKFARSASFSAGDVHIQRPPVVDEKTKRPTPATMRPPPFMRRRSSSLPHLFQDSLTGEASEGRAGETDYWHTGNLQQLINSRNQEPDVDEGIIEVQLLKEQQSIGLMVVGGLDTHLGMLYIKDIQPNSPAANCNRLRVGDQLLQVNDSCLVGVTHGEALNILKNTPPLVKLTVARKKDGESDGLELVAEGRRVTDAEEPIVSAARESSTISKTASELPVSPPPDRGQRPKSLVSLSSFGTSFNNDPSPVSPCGSFDESDDYVPAYLEPESPTLTLGQDDVPVTIIDGIPGENDSTTTEEEEEMKPFSKSVSWAVSSDDTKVFTVELFKNGRAGLGLSVSGGVDTAYDDIMVRQILSNSVTAHNGHIKKGDILLSVNGKSFKGLTNSEALTLLKDTPERVTLVVSRPLGHKQHSKAMTLLRNKNTNKEIISDSEAWPTREELAKKKNLANTNSNTPPTLEKIPLDVAKQNGEHSTFDRLKKRFFSNGGPMNLKERLHKVPQGPSVTEITLEKGASGLGFSLGGGQDSLYGDAPIHVRYVFKESVAGRSGALKPGDEILEVNGQKVAYMTNVDVLELIRRLPYGPVVMKIRRK